MFYREKMIVMNDATNFLASWFKHQLDKIAESNGYKSFYDDQLEKIAEADAHGSFHNEDDETCDHLDFSDDDIAASFGMSDNEDTKNQIREARMALDIACRNMRNERNEKRSESELREIAHRLTKMIGKDYYDRIKKNIIVKCPKCKKNHLAIRHNRKLDLDFIGCSGFPKCKFNWSVFNTFEESRHPRRQNAQTH